MFNFPTSLVPDGAIGQWRVETYSVNEKESALTRIRSALNGSNDAVPPGTYKRLMRGKVVVMSNTPMEFNTNVQFINRAKGDVLINGLGLGIVLNEILRKPEVATVTVVEASSEVIDLVSPSFRDNPKVRIVHADAFKYKPAPGQRFHVVWHDIWDGICADNLPEMHALHRKYSRRTEWQASWCRDLCERQRNSITKELYV